MDILHLEYTEQLSSTYTKNHLELDFDEKNNLFRHIYFYNSQYGTIELKNNKKEVHKWETEDEAKEGSYLKKNFQIICLDGIAHDPKIEDKIISENMNYINKLELEEKELLIIHKAIEVITRIE